LSLIVETVLAIIASWAGPGETKLADHLVSRPAQYVEKSLLRDKTK
jgi:hypothetical protein